MAQNDNNMGVVVALVGIAVAAVALFTGSASASRPTSREQVMEQMRPSLVDQLQDAVDSAASSGSSTGAGDVAEYVERTGLLPSGNDVASRIGTINNDDFQEDYEPGQGFVGL